MPVSISTSISTFTSTFASFLVTGWFLVLYFYFA